MKKTLLTMATVSLIAYVPHAQIVVNALHAPITENFDGMGSSGTTTPSGWFVGFGTDANSTTVVTGTGSSNAGGNYNFGSSGSSDRALGSLASGAGTRNTEVRFQNLTGSSISSMIISYDGEQWRLGAASSLETGLRLKFSTDGAAFANVGVSFDFSPPVTSGTIGLLDGNAAANRTPGLGGTYTLATPIVNGGLFYVRWEDVDNSGSDSAMSIDDFSITAVPEPRSCTLLIGLALLAFPLFRDTAARWQARRRAWRATAVARTTPFDLWRCAGAPGSEGAGQKSRGIVRIEVH